MSHGIKHCTYIICVALGIFACTNNRHSPGELEQEKVKLQKVLQDYVHAQYNFLVKDTAALWTNFVENKTGDTFQRRIQEYKTNLASQQLSYTAFTSSVVIDSAIFNGDSATVFSTDRYTLTSSDRDPRDTSRFIVTKGIYKYRVGFLKKENSWLIREFFCRDISRFSYNPFPKIVQEVKVSEAAQPLSYAYNPESARAYAERHWENGNIAYCDFSNPNGDCTNFLSQCLYTGGWPQDAVWKSKLKRDCPSCRNSSCLAMECYGCRWAVAQDFKYYITHEGKTRVESKAQASDLEVGDIIQFDYQADGEFDHNTIVSSKTGSGASLRVRVAYRTSQSNDPAYDKPYQEVGGTGTVLFWKVKPL